MLDFKPKQTVKNLLSVLPDRARDVLERRYGIGKSSKSATLESIGQMYGITRERVRQIENYAIRSIQKSDAYTAEQAVFDELRDVIESLGGIVGEDELLSMLSADNPSRSQVLFLLVLGEPFYRQKENQLFAHRWFTEQTRAEAVENALTNLCDALSQDELVSEEEMLTRLRDTLDAKIAQACEEETLRRWLRIAKAIDRNPLGEWGPATSPNVRAKGIRDYAYLAVKRHGSPMHFKEVASAIQELFEKKAHIATTHNELIKDKRFVLVGRGLYALTEWGYSAGVVKDVLREILEQNGPLTRDEIVDKVRKERYVKDNTIVVNLQDPTFFKRRSDGTYMIVE